MLLAALQTPQKGATQAAGFEGRMRPSQPAAPPPAPRMPLLPSDWSVPETQPLLLRTECHGARGDPLSLLHLFLPSLAPHSKNVL